MPALRRSTANVLNRTACTTAVPRRPLLVSPPSTYLHSRRARMAGTGGAELGTVPCNPGTAVVRNLDWFWTGRQGEVRPAQ